LRKTLDDVVRENGPRTRKVLARIEELSTGVEMVRMQIEQWEQERSSEAAEIKMRALENRLKKEMGELEAMVRKGEQGLASEDRFVRTSKVGEEGWWVYFEGNGRSIRWASSGHWIGILFRRERQGEGLGF
jgi:hypothetical protein